jgi:hypothetical protein
LSLSSEALPTRRKPITVSMDGGLPGWTSWLHGCRIGLRSTRPLTSGWGRVLLLFSDFARARHPAGGQFPSANIWTVRDGGIARIEVYVEHDHALKAVGLEG